MPCHSLFQEARGGFLRYSYLYLHAYAALTVNCMCRAAARFCYAVLLSMGPKKSHGTDAVAKSSREIQNRRARGRGRRSRGARLASSGGFAAPGARGAVPVDLAGWKAGDAARDRPRSRLAASRPDPATKGGRYKPGAGGAARVPRGAAELRGAGVVVVVVACKNLLRPSFFHFGGPLLHLGGGEISAMSSRPPSAAHGPFRTPTPARSALEAQPGHSPLASTPPTALALAEGGAGPGRRGRAGTRVFFGGSSRRFPPVRQ